MIIVKNRPLAFKNNAPFISYVLNANNMLIDIGEDLDVAMPMQNLIEYSKNYSLWHYYRDQLSDDTNDNNDPNKNVTNSKSFQYKTSITGTTYNVVAKITNEEGNQVNNPAYDANKSGKKSWNCCSSKIFE